MLRAQGALSVGPRGGWRLGWLGLQGSTFTFHGAGTRAAVTIDLAAITGLDRERKTFVLVSKHVLRLTYRPAAAALAAHVLADHAPAGRLGSGPGAAAGWPVS